MSPLTPVPNDVPLPQTDSVGTPITRTLTADDGTVLLSVRVDTGEILTLEAARLVEAVSTLLERLGAQTRELALIDMLLARRPALDLPTRTENIAKAIHVAGEMTDRVAQLERERT